MSNFIFDSLKMIGNVAKKTHFYRSHSDTAKSYKSTLWNFFVNGSIINDRGSSFMDTKGQRNLFNRRNKGLLIDGYNKRISQDLSYKHIAIIAKTGVGKTQNYILPNILSLADFENSILVTDPSGELYESTSAYMQKKGFKVLKLDPVNLSESIRFNPLANAKTETDISNLAKVLIESSLGKMHEPYWVKGAEPYLAFFIKCLKTAPEKYKNLHNLQYLLQNLEPTGKRLNPLVSRMVSGNPRLQAKWVELISSGNDKTKGSFITTALNALSNLSNDDLAHLTAKNTIDFTSFRREKTILYLTFPAQHQDYYSFILNVFYTQFFYACMEKRPSENDLPIEILYDEFGHSSIPNFPAIATQIRKFKVSISIVLQSLSQLVERYGVSGSETILEGGIASKLFYAGADVKTAKEIEKMLGTVIRDEVHTGQNGTSTSKRQFNLLNSDEITRLKDNQAIFLTENKDPILLDTVPCYNNIFMKNKLSSRPVQYDENIIDDPLELIPLV